MLDKGHEGLDPEVSAFGRCWEVLGGMGFTVSFAILNLNQSTHFWHSMVLQDHIVA